MATHEPGNDLVEQLYRALEGGQRGKAYEIARRLERAGALEPDAEIAVAVANIEVDKPKPAIERLERLASAKLDGHFEYERLWHLATAYHLVGRPDAALDILYVLEPPDPIEKANLYWWRGLNHDLKGDRERADRCFEAAKDLDPSAPNPVNMSPEEVHRIVKLVRARLPEPIREALDEVPIVIDDLPSLDLIRKGGIAPDTLGLYSGSHLLERSFLDAGGLPPQIFLFRRNLERFARTREELVAEIETTLLHELGHHLGYEEDDLDSLGLA